MMVLRMQARTAGRFPVRAFLTEGDVSDVVEAVLHLPVPADQGGQGPDVGLVGGEAGDDVDDFLGGALAVQAAAVAHDPQDLGGGLLLNQKTDESHRSEVDFGKLEYPADDLDTPFDKDDISTWGANYEGGNGGITGIAFNAITRNELDARLQAVEDYEAGIPDVLMRLWGLGVDG